MLAYKRKENNMDKETFEALSIVLRATNIIHRDTPDDATLDKAINLVWAWQDEVAKEIE